MSQQQVRHIDTIMASTESKGFPAVEFVPNPVVETEQKFRERWSEIKDEDLLEWDRIYHVWLQRFRLPNDMWTLTYGGKVYGTSPDTISSFQRLFYGKRFYALIYLLKKLISGGIRIPEETEEYIHDLLAMLSYWQYQNRDPIKYHDQLYALLTHEHHREQLAHIVHILEYHPTFCACCSP